MAVSAMMSTQRLPAGRTTPKLVAPPAARCGCGRGAASGAAQGAASLAPPGSAASSTPAAKFHAKDSEWILNPGSASQDPRAQKAYAGLQAFVRKYPTEAALKAAGFTTDKPGGNHYKGPGMHEIYPNDGQTGVAWVVVDKGKVVSAQLDSNARKASDPPPSWKGVAWHYHDHGKSSWMFHVRADKPIDEAFVEQKPGRA